MRIRLILPLLIIVCSLFAFSEQISYAQSFEDPDFISILEVRSYTDVLEDGDYLIVARYELEYEEVPEIDIGTAFLARFMDGDNLLGTTEIYPLVIPNNGYDIGLFSFYFPVQPVPVTGFRAVITGNPILFPTSTGNTASNSAIEGPFTQAQLASHINASAVLFQTRWRDTDSTLILIERTPEGNRFTLLGEEYFSNSISQLSDMAGRLFQSRLFTPSFREEEFEHGYTEQLRNYWEGTSFQDSIDGLAEYVSAPSILVSTAILLATAGGIAFYVLVGTQKPQMAIMSGYLVIIFGGLLGWTPFEFVAILGLIGVVAIGYIFFYRSSAA